MVKVMDRSCFYSRSVVVVMVIVVVVLVLLVVVVVVVNDCKYLVYDVKVVRKLDKCK